MESPFTKKGTLKDGYLKKAIKEVKDFGLKAELVGSNLTDLESYLTVETEMIKLDYELGHIVRIEQREKESPDGGRKLRTKLDKIQDKANEVMIIVHHIKATYPQISDEVIEFRINQIKNNFHNTISNTIENYSKKEIKISGMNHWQISEEEEYEYHEKTEEITEKITETAKKVGYLETIEIRANVEQMLLFTDKFVKHNQKEDENSIYNDKDFTKLVIDGFIFEFYGQELNSYGELNSEYIAEVMKLYLQSFDSKGVLQGGFLVEVKKIVVKPKQLEMKL